jgi:hypothetical protein
MYFSFWLIPNFLLDFEWRNFGLGILSEGFPCEIFLPTVSVELEGGNKMAENELLS